MFHVGEHKSPEFLKLNPHGEVPVLVDGETSVFEACAILRYLAFKYTDHKDFGKSMAERMKVGKLFCDLQWPYLHSLLLRSAFS